MYRTEVRLTRHEVTERSFKCAHCGAKGELQFRAVGQSHWQREGGLLAPDPHEDLERAAEKNLRDDAERVVALTACPSCGKRAPGAMFWLAVRAGFWFVLGAAVPVIGGTELLLGTAACVVFGGFQTWREVGRLRRARAAQVTKLVPGAVPKAALPVPKPPKPLPAPVRPEIPAARAITAPAAPRAKTADGSEEPAFLRER